MSIQKCLTVAAMVLLNLFGSGLMAQEGNLDDMSLEDLMGLNRVVGASKYEQKLQDAPADVTIITADEIRRFGYRNLYEVLNSVRGIYMTDDRNYNFMGVRGFNRPGDFNGRILITLNGHRMNENVYDSVGFKGDEPVSLNLVERIEVIRGPASSLYGSNAVFGVINIVTIAGSKINGFQVSGAAGTFDSSLSLDNSTGEVNFGRALSDDSDLLIGIKTYNSSGQELEFEGLGTTKKTDYEYSYRGFASYKAGDFGVHTDYFNRRKGIPAGAYTADFDSTANESLDARFYIEGTHQHQFSEKLRLNSRLFYDTYEFNGNYAFSGVVNKDRGYGEFVGGELRVTADTSSDLRFVGGLEYKDNLKQDQKNYDDATEYLNIPKSSNAFAAFLQSETKFSQQFLINFGLRYDDISYLGDTNLAPRLGIIYNHDTKNNFKLLYGEAFRAPNQYELFYESLSFTPAQLANPDLKPEEIKTYELVTQHIINTDFSLGLVVFYYQVDNLINQNNESGSLIFRNITAGVEASGAEVQLNFKILDRTLEGSLAVTTQTVEYSSTSERLSNSPESLGKFNFSYRIMDGFFIATDTQYVSSTKDVNSANISAYTVTNLSLTGQNLIAQNLNLTLRVGNIFDEQYSVPVGDQYSFTPVAIEQDGLNAELKFSYNF